MVYESYRDVALPWLEISDLDLVLGVEPGRVAAYDAHKWLEACRLTRGIRQDIEISTASILPLVKPHASRRIPPATKGNMQNKVELKIHDLLAQQLSN